MNFSKKHKKNTKLQNNTQNNKHILLFFIRLVWQQRWRFRCRTRPRRRRCAQNSRQHAASPAQLFVPVELQNGAGVTQFTDNGKGYDREARRVRYHIAGAFVSFVVCMSHIVTKKKNKNKKTLVFIVKK